MLLLACDLARHRAVREARPVRLARRDERWLTQQSLDAAGPAPCWPCAAAQGVRRAGRHRRPRPRRRAGECHALIGPNGAGQDDAARAARGRARARPRQHPVRRTRRDAAGPRRARSARDRALVPDHHAGRRLHRRGQRRARGAGAARDGDALLEAARSATAPCASRRARRSRASGSQRARTFARPISRTASSACSSSRSRSRKSPPCCCSTSRWRAWDTTRAAR